MSSLAAVTGFDDRAPTIVVEADLEQIRAALRDVVADILDDRRT